MSDCIIETKGLTKRYGEQVSVSSLDLHVQKGRIYGLLGRNGAGKTTLARCLCGLMKEQAGTILWDGSPLGRKERRRKAFLIMQDVNLQLFADSVLAEARLGNDANEMETMAVPNPNAYEDQTIQGSGMVLVPDLPENCRLLREFLYGTSGTDNAGL